MKNVVWFVLVCASSAFGQGFSVSVGAVAGSYSASSGVAVVNMTGIGTADAGVTARNEGASSSTVSTVLPAVPLPTPLASQGGSLTQNTTAVTPHVNLPAGGTGGAGGAGVGAAFAATAVQGVFVTVGPVPVLQLLLPLPPVLGTLPTF